ncbi:protein NDNF-like [Colias croceus]|uniref:protein NDNF-like n=1 Tax=Colias crocea TaxID=72248 RepID=UPI001E27EA8F|nr:protein NDNF-like [Colias croceus]
MGSLNRLTVRVATLIVLHAAGAGLAAPSVLVTRPVARLAEWLPMDNQTVYRLDAGETRNLELNTTQLSLSSVFITISPCTRDFHWALYRGEIGRSDDHLDLIQESSGGDVSTLSAIITNQDRYLLQLFSSKGGAAAVSVRGEAPRPVRMRLRIRSRRRLSANWDPSPIDPQMTTYCVVASHRKNYTSLCAAQADTNICTNRQNLDDSSNEKRQRNRNNQARSDDENTVDMDVDRYSIFDGNYRNVFRRKKFGRSTRVSNEDPVIACVGDRTHHLIENLDPSTTYFVSVFGVARDRRAGSLLATGSVRPRTSTAKRLRENVPLKSDVKGKSVYYFKAAVGTGGGVWLALTTCGGSVDVEVGVKGKRLYSVKDIEPYSKFFIPAPIPSSSIQETSDEGSVQFDSSSEEAKVRYVIRVTPNRWYRDTAVNVELTASTTRWGLSTPELLEDGATVRELRPRRSCKSVDIAFLPANHNATDVIRYCIITRETSSIDGYTCMLNKKSGAKVQCISHMQRPPTRVIVQKVAGLKAGRKYAIQVTAANKGSPVPYKVLYADTNASCKD